jgi:hypothetical protein
MIWMFSIIGLSDIVLWILCFAYYFKKEDIRIVLFCKTMEEMQKQIDELENKNGKP